MLRYNTIHLRGFIQNHSDGVRFNGDYDNIADIIAGRIDSNMRSAHENEDGYNTHSSVYVPNVFIRMYFSDEEISLENAIEKQILNTIGSLDIYTEWYGYSEWSIEGYSVDNFTIGNHNLERILGGYNGKYVHILLDAIER